MNCKATTIDGKPCGANQIRANGFCYWHDPDLEEERREKRARGGKNSSNAARAKKAMKQYEGMDLVSVLHGVLDGLLTGNHEPGVANAAANVAKAISQLRTSQELEARIAGIEAIVNEAKTA